MQRRILVITGCGFLLVGILLLAGFILVLGINDGEWGHIHETGHISDESHVAWTDWQASNSLVRPSFDRLMVESLSGNENLEFRKGKADGLLFDFTVYECRDASGGITKVFPAIGPGWGATYHYRWAISALVIGCCFLSVAFFRRH